MERQVRRMRNVKIILSLLLTTALIGTMAFLPQIAAFFLDRSTIGKVGTAPMQTVQLEFHSEDIPPEPGDLLRKLSLQSRMSTVPINPEQATLTQAQVFEYVDIWMGDYINAGIFQWFDETYRYAEPYIGIDPENTANYNIFWGITIVNEKDPYHSLFLHIDDETGKILYIQYQIYRSFSTETVLDYTQFIMDAFVNIYFDQLLYESDTLPAPTVDEGVVDGDVLYCRFTFPDTGYGEIVIEFETAGSGSFWMNFTK